MGRLRASQRSAIIDDPMRVWGPKDPSLSFINSKNKVPNPEIQEGIVIQFNIGMYSALVMSKYGGVPYVCFVGSFNITTGFGYSDSIVLTEGDEVIFAVIDNSTMEGVILAKKPVMYSVDDTHPIKVESDTNLERRTHFFGNDCYRKKTSVYDAPLLNPEDISTARYGDNRPTDLIQGEYGSLNQHRNGLLQGIYSCSIVGGGSQIKLFSLENRIRVVADSIIKYTLFGNDVEWHNRRYLSRERASCMYQEERLGLPKKKKEAFEKSDYDDDFYFTKNKKKKQTLRPRILDYEGYFAGLSSRYCLRPEPDSEDPRVMDDKPKDPGVFRESIDPSGQCRLAFTGMLGLERVGRIPVPVRIKYPWSKDAEEPKAKALEEFKHSKDNPFYRQLELADRIAFDVKNSYSRFDEAEKEFYTPEESDLKDKLKDVYDKGFTESTTVKLEKYDKRRSGIWQGEDGSIIIRDAWGSEIVMIGGNIQLSCAGNIEIMPGKTSLTLAGDDIVQKAQNSIDIESADKDVRINGFKNVQILAGVDDKNPGGVTIEAKGKSNPWDAKSVDGGEELKSSGILLKSHDGAVITDADKALIRAGSKISVVAGKDKISGGEGTISLSADTINEYGKSANIYTDTSSLALGDTAILSGESVSVASIDNTIIAAGSEVFVPMMMAPTQANIAETTKKGNQQQIKNLQDESIVSFQYDSKQLEKMLFKFRSSKECGTDKSWEIKGGNDFMLYQPFWVQMKKKFETLKDDIDTQEFDDHEQLWKDDTGAPWPGKDAVKEGKYAKLAQDEPINLDEDGFNKARKEIKNESAVTTVKLFTGYQIRKEK